MTRTTIDGLKVRDAQPDRTVKPVRSSSHAIDITTTRAERRVALDSIEKIRKKNPRVDSFLDPVETFDFDGETETRLDDRFDSEAEADWSELLADQVDNQPNYNDTADLLSDWGATDDEEDLSGSNEARRDFLARNTSDDSDFLTKNALNDEDEPTPRRARRLRPAKRKRHIGRTVAILSLCLLVVVGGVVYKWGDELISKLTGGRSGLFGAIQSIMSDAVPFDTDTNGRTNILIFGTEGYNMNGDTAYGAHDGAQLTDSIMVASIDQETKDVALLSLPRDLKVSRACSAGKVNEVFWCYNQDGQHEEEGARALMEQVGTVLGVDFQYYAHVNWASLIDIIDTLGGITVTLDEDIADYSYTGAVAQAGVPITVNGEQALGLARARHGTQGGDFTRGNTQQKIVQAIADKVMQNGIGIAEAFNLVNILGDNLRSNFSTDNIKAGVKMLTDFNIANIRQVPLVDYENNVFYMTTATINDISYVVPAAGERDYSQIQAYVAEMFSSNPTAREHARMMVYNASGQYGVAGAERDRLIADGYEVAGVGDAELGVCESSYCIYAVGQDFPATSSTLESRYGATMQNATEVPSGVEYVDGVDFLIVIGLGGSEG